LWKDAGIQVKKVCPVVKLNFWIVWQKKDVKHLIESFIDTY
jgi:hypothetical protein